MKPKLTFWTYFFFIICYSNQGLSGLPDQVLYYLTRETWKLTASQIGLIGLLTGLAWYSKFIFGYLNDYVPIKNYANKYYLILSYLIMLVCIIYIVIFGLNIISLVITGLLINLSIALADVANDKQMCLLERQYNLSGKIQSIQWSALSVCGLFVSLLGAWLATNLPEPINYKIGYAICSIIPITALIYLNTKYFEKPINKIKKFKWSIFKNFKQKDFLLGLCFIILLRFKPSFGTGLMIKCREELYIDKMFIGYLGALGTFISIIGYGLYYWKAHKIPLKKLLYFSIIFTGLTNIFYLYIPNQWYLVYYSLLFGAFEGIAFLSVMAFMVKILPQGSEAIFYAVVTSANNLASRLGITAGSFIYDAYGYNVNVIVSTICTFLALFFIPFLKCENEA